MNDKQSQLRPGDWVEVLSPDEILLTLDAEGTLERLPFMPEMMEYCGRRFRIAKRVLKTCYYGPGSGMRKFPDDNVFLLAELRCSGAAHDGCQKGCTIFWREAWLRPVTGKEEIQSTASTESSQRLRGRLKVSRGPNRYFCQASEILNATEDLSHWQRLGNCFADVRAGNSSLLRMTKLASVWLFWRVRKLLLGPYARGPKQATPAENLNLKSGECVEIRPLHSISKTLNERAYNRGLFFTPAMGAACGERFRVKDRIRKIIVDGTGEMRHLDNTVFLEGSFCGCSCVAFGGCPRGEYAYWREIWLSRRGASQADSDKRPDETPAPLREIA